MRSTSHPLVVSSLARADGADAPPAATPAIRMRPIAARKPRRPQSILAPGCRHRSGRLPRHHDTR